MVKRRLYEGDNSHMDTYSRFILPGLYKYNEVNISRGR